MCGTNIELAVFWLEPINFIIICLPVFEYRNENINNSSNILENNQFIFRLNSIYTLNKIQVFGSC